MTIFRGAGTPASGESATFVTKEDLASTTTDLVGDALLGVK